MKYQQVSVDYWAMGKSMLTYAFLAAMGWLMLRLFNTVFMLPRRMRSQQENIQHTLTELQKRYPALNITEEDLVNAKKEFEEIMKEDKEKREKIAIEEKERNNVNSDEEQTNSAETSQIEDKKTI